MKRIDTLEQWETVAAAIREKGHRLWQWQYRYDHPEGFHTWVWAEGKNVEFITYSKQVQDAMISFNTYE
jgi:hypothetical protein